ncbi:MAG: DUF488 family protein [Candidatus Methylacidiphilales bacterium]
MAELFTLGYERTTQTCFLHALKSRDISTLIDVRSRPLSRKPGFSKTSLAKGCEGEGIRYEHESVFGCPIPILNQYRIDGNWSAYCIQFNKHLPSIIEAIEELASRALKEHLCLVCFEADPFFCHRSILANAAAEICPRLEIVHLTSSGQTVVAR